MGELGLRTETGTTGTWRIVARAGGTRPGPRAAGMPGFPQETGFLLRLLAALAIGACAACADCRREGSRPGGQSVPPDACGLAPPDAGPPRPVELMGAISVERGGLSISATLRNTGDEDIVVFNRMWKELDRKPMWDPEGAFRFAHEAGTLRILVGLDQGDEYEDSSFSFLPLATRLHPGESLPIRLQFAEPVTEYHTDGLDGFSAEVQTRDCVELLVQWAPARVFHLTPSSLDPQALEAEPIDFAPEAPTHERWVGRRACGLHVRVRLGYTFLDDDGDELSGDPFLSCRHPGSTARGCKDLSERMIWSK